LACQALGIDLKVRHLDSELSREEVAKIVKSLNTRRNLTMTQKIASAYRQQVVSKETNDEIARQWAISVPSLKNMKYIARCKPEFVEPLFNGNTVSIVDVSTGIVVSTNKVNTIARLVKKGVEDGRVVMDNSEQIEFAADGVIKTEAGKDWYYRLVKGRVLDVEMKMLLVELANYKFSSK